jgi:hypothetical protein
MAFDPEEFVTLTDHGAMKLRSAVSRAMTLLPKERKRATIVREGDPAILNFEQIKNLAAQWDKPLVPIDWRCAVGFGSGRRPPQQSGPDARPRHPPLISQGRGRAFDPSQCWAWSLSDIGVSMFSLQHLAAAADTIANLIAQLRELDQLRERVGKAELAWRSWRVDRRKSPRIRRHELRGRFRRR